MEKNLESSAYPPAYTPPPPNLQYESQYPAPGPVPYPPPGSYPSSESYPVSGSSYPAPQTEYPPGQQQYGFGKPWPAGYPSQPGYGTPQYGAQPQHQQQVVMVGASSQHQPVIVQHVETYVGHIVFACLVIWFCNWLFGLIAFILAVVASSTAVSDPIGARKLGRASIGLSVTGIIVTAVIIIIVVAVVVSAGASVASSCRYYIYGNCYQYKKSYYYYLYCSGIVYGSYCYYN